MQKIHVEAVGDSPAEFKALIDAELEKLGALTKRVHSWKLIVRKFTLKKNHL